MPTRNVNLTDRYDQFVERQINAGRYRNASEVMRAALGLLEQRIQEEQEKLSLLRSLAAEGFEQLDQGRGIEVSGSGNLAKLIGQIGRKAATAAKSRAEKE